MTVEQLDARNRAALADLRNRKPKYLRLEYAGSHERCPNDVYAPVQEFVEHVMYEIGAALIVVEIFLDKERAVVDYCAPDTRLRAEPDDAQKATIAELHSLVDGRRTRVMGDCDPLPIQRQWTTVEVPISVADEIAEEASRLDEVFWKRSMAFVGDVMA